MVDTQMVLGLAVGYFGGQYFGKVVENVIKPNIVVGSSQTDKILAGIANDGTKAGIAYAANSLSKGRPGFAKNMLYGAVLSAVVDAGYRYIHSGVPSDYMLFGIPLLTENNHNQNYPTNSDVNSVSRINIPLVPEILPISQVYQPQHQPVPSVYQPQSALITQAEQPTLITRAEQPTLITQTEQSSPVVHIVQTDSDVSAIPDRARRFGFMESTTQRKYGFMQGCPISEREKHFGFMTG